MIIMMTPSGLTDDEIYAIMLKVTAENGGKYNYIGVIKGMRRLNHCSLKDAKESADMVAVPLYKKGLVGKYGLHLVDGYIDGPITEPCASIPLTPTQIVALKKKRKSL